MQKLQYEQVRYANGSVPAESMFSHGQSSMCEDLLNNYSTTINSVLFDKPGCTW